MNEKSYLYFQDRMCSYGMVDMEHDCSDTVRYNHVNCVVPTGYRNQDNPQCGTGEEDRADSFD